MIKKYLYNGKEYLSAYQVRQAIFEAERKAFPAEPKEGKADFWAEHNVVYTEEDTPLEALKAQKHAQIKLEFLKWRDNDATLVSLLGFKADANERANTDVSGLLVAYEDNQEALITFRDADNEFHVLTYAQVKTLRKEIIENGNFAYAQKWELEKMVAEASDKEELSLIRVEFEGKDFTK